MRFSEVLDSIAPRAHGGCEITVGDDWLQGRATFGGLIAAVGNAAMRRLVSAERPLRSLQTTFAGPATPGTWRIDTRVLRVGKAVTLAQCEIIDGDRVAATQVGVYGLARPSSVLIKPAAAASPRQVEELREMGHRPGHSPAFLQYFAIRWAEGAKPFTATRSRSKAFVRHREEATVTESHVVALIDCIPSPAISMLSAPAPASSLVWTLEFFEHDHAFAAEAWWRIDTDIDAAADGYVNQTSLLHDPTGRPVALSRQLVAVFG